MCIIGIKPLKIKDFSEEILQNCWNRNSDGAGYAFWDAEKSLWSVRKGFMKWKDFMESYESNHFGEDDCTFVHFRIGTAGLKDGGNTHPFPICDDLEAMRVTEFDTNMLAIHNGVVGKGDNKYSDTMIYIKEYLHPLMPVWNDERIRRNVADRILEKGSSRWVVAIGNGYWKYGTWANNEGQFFSNDNFKTWYTASNNTSHFPATAGSYNSNTHVNTVPEGVWAHGQLNGAHGFWQNGKFTSWKEWYAQRRSLQSQYDMFNVTEVEAEAIVTVLLEIETQEEFSKRYIKQACCASSSKFIDVMDWRGFARDMMALRLMTDQLKNWVKNGDKPEIKDETEKLTPAEKWAMGITDTLPEDTTTTTNDDSPVVDANKDPVCICPNCAEDKYLTDSPFTVGDTICEVCGCVFTTATGFIHLFDTDMHREFLSKS